MNVGIELRNTRLQRGMSLEDLANSTKIKVPVLRALEEGDVAGLPPIVYVLGYLRTYAQELRLDYDDIVHRYLDYIEQENARTRAQAARAEAARARRDRSTPPPASAPADSPASNSDSAGDARFGILGRLLRSRTLMAAAAVLLLIFAVIAFQPRARALRSQPVTADLTSAAAHAAPATAVTAASAIAPGVPFRVAITPTQAVWVSASADGQSVVSRQMNPGERAVIDVQGRIVLRVSDPSGVTWSIDGREGRPLGKAGEYVTVQITRDTLDQFVSD
jgi:cytoskeletal protein RodZ